jgi:hypothetical protein
MHCVRCAQPRAKLPIVLFQHVSDVIRSASTRDVNGPRAKPRRAAVFVAIAAPAVRRQSGG